MPASEATLSLFISSVGAGHVASGTVGSWLSGLQLWHQLNSAPWLGGEILLRAKKGVSKLAPPSFHRLPRDPVSFNHMLVLREVLDLSNTLDSAIWAAVTSAWRGCARLGELLVGSVTSFTPARNVTHRCQMKRGSTSNGHKFLKLKLPWTKTQLAAGDWLILTETFDSVNAVATVEHHLVVNANIPHDAPLFSYETPTSWAPLTCDVFMGRCNAIWRDAGMGALYGHRFHISGMTHLLISGVEPWTVMKQGCWSSKAFLLYWRNIEDILPLFIGDALDKLCSIKDSISRLANL
ncbi:DNA breaking-rejoining enzyme [Mycena latifolia]|nr:DNA breaking-rejoining enzyme [Mycena latifolia]